MIMAAMGFAVTSWGCDDEKTSATTQQQPVVPPPIAESTPVKPVVPSKAPQELEQPLRLAVQIPGDGIALDRRHLKNMKATVTIGGHVVPSPAQVRTMADAREGFSILLVVSGKNRALLGRGAKLLLRELTFRDRVAVGTIDAQGFRLLVGFSADPQGASAALDTIIRAEDATGKTPGTPTMEAIMAAVQHFPGGSLPPQRVLMLAQDQSDELWSRPAQRRRMATRMQRLLIRNDIRLLVADTHQTKPGDMGWRHQAEATGGHFVYIRPATDDPFDNPLSDGYRTINSFLRNRAVVDVTVSKQQTSQPMDVAVTLTPSQQEMVNQRHVSIAPKEDERPFIDVAMPAMPDVPLLPGTFSLEYLRSEAENADKAEEKLRAAVLWEMAQETNPEDKNIRRQAHRAMTLFQETGAPRGLIQNGTTPIEVDVVIRNDTKAVTNTWKSLTGVTDGLTQCLQRRAEARPENLPPLTAGEGSPINQIVLHRCLRHNAGDCVRFLLSERSMTHFVIEADGTLVQVADLAMAVNHHKTTAYDQIAIHVVLPESKAPLFQDPTLPATWRQPRVRKSNVEVNGVFQHGWGMTLAQRHNLVALVRALADALPNISPVFPIDLQRNPTFAALLNPDDHRGLISHSNLDKRVTQCPGPGLDLKSLNDAISGWKNDPISLNMEDWIADLTNSGVGENAMSRFASIDPVGVPILLEVLREVPLKEHARPEMALPTRAVEAMRRHSSRPGADLFVSEITEVMQSAPHLSETEFYYLQALLTGLVQTANATHAAAINAWIAQWTQMEQESTASDWLPAIRTGLAALLVAANQPDHVTQVLPLLKHQDDEVRAQAILTLTVHDPTSIQPQVSRLLNDSNPWNRLLTARVATKNQWKVLYGLVGTIPMQTLTSIVQEMWPKEPQPETLRWYQSKDISSAERAALRSLYVHWKWDKAVPVLARQLSKVHGMERWLVTQTLRTITERDFGSSPAGWLQWRPRTGAGAK